MKISRKKMLEVVSTYLDSYSQIVLLYALVIQLMVNLDVGPGDRLLGSLLKVKRVKLVGLSGGSRHQPVKHRRIILDSRAVDTHTIHKCYKIGAGSPITSAFFGVRYLTNGKRETETETRTEITQGRHMYIYISKKYKS